MKTYGLRFAVVCVALAAVPGMTVAGPASAEAFQFTDTAQQTGILPAVTGIQGHGAAWGDIDGDGWIDLYVGTFHTEGHPNMLLRNRQGTFELDVQEAPRVSARATGVVFADLDNDGDVDLYFASMPGPEGSRLAQRAGHPLDGCTLFRNDGGGKLTNVSPDNGACPDAFGGRSVAVLDYNGDSLLDLLVGEDPVTGYNGSKTRTSRMFRNSGGLQFEDVSQEIGIPNDAAGLGVAAADVNNDGWPDFFLASTLGNHLMLNDGTGRFRESPGAREVFAWPTAKGDDMVCGVAFGDVNRDGLLDVVIGQHYERPWVKPVANRLYLNRGITEGVPAFEDVTERVGLVPLPMKSPHVEIQDFDNDGWPDIATSIVKFAEGRPHPVIFRHAGLSDGLPKFETRALDANDFPTEEDKAVKRTGAFFDKLVRERKIIYTAPGPTGDYDNDGRLDMFLPNWFTNSPSLLLHNETEGGHWLEVQFEGSENLNRQGIGSRINVYPAGQLNNRSALLGSREIAVGFGYASGQPAIAHFGLGDDQHVDIEVVLPHSLRVISQKNVAVDRRLTIRP